MSEAEVAIQTATITVWGAVTVGILATLGTIVSALLAPFWIRRSERREADRRDRMENLRRIIPTFIDLSTRFRFKVGDDPSFVGAQALAAVTELELWLTPDEWPISRIAMHGLLIDHSKSGKAAKRAPHVAQFLLAAWARGEVTADEAKRRYERDVEVTVIPSWGSEEPMRL